MIGSEQIIRARKGPAPAENPIFICGGECGRMTRPSTTKLADAPGTVCRGSKTMCTTCYHALKPAKHREIKRHMDPPSEKVRATLSSLDTFMAERNRRLAKRQERLLNRRTG